MGGRDIGVVSIVLALGWRGSWVCGVSLFDVFPFFFGVIVIYLPINTII